MLGRGYYTLFRWGGAPVRIHWSWPLGAALLVGFGMFPWPWLAFGVLVLVHELGHAWLVKRFRLRVESIDLLGFGGECRYAGRPSEVEIAIIAWGGVLAQALLLAVIVAADAFLPPEVRATTPWRVAHHVGIRANLLMIGFNLLPFRPLDGYLAWRLPRLWLAARVERARARQLADLRRHERIEKATQARARQAARALREVEKHDEADDDALPVSVREQLSRAMEAAAEAERDGSTGD